MTDAEVPFLHHGKRVGHVKGSTYYTHRRPDDHFCIRHQGYGLQQEVLRHLLTEGIATVVLTLESPGGLKAYRTPTLLWKFAGTVDDLGDGLQVFLSTRQLERAHADPEWAGALVQRIKANKENQNR